MTEVREFALEATKRYLQSIVFVDDKIYYEVPVKAVDVETNTASPVRRARRGPGDRG